MLTFVSGKTIGGERPKKLQSQKNRCILNREAQIASLAAEQIEEEIAENHYNLISVSASSRLLHFQHAEPPNSANLLKRCNYSELYPEARAVSVS